MSVAPRERGLARRSAPRQGRFIRRAAHRPGERSLYRGPVGHPAPRWPYLLKATAPNSDRPVSRWACSYSRESSPKQATAPRSVAPSLPGRLCEEFTAWRRRGRRHPMPPAGSHSSHCSARFSVRRSGPNISAPGRSWVSHTTNLSRDCRARPPQHLLGSAPCRRVAKSCFTSSSGE